MGNIKTFFYHYKGKNNFRYKNIANCHTIAYNIKVLLRFMRQIVSKDIK